jgi:recombinational DNA repair protein (RecF pathway)
MRYRLALILALVILGTAAASQAVKRCSLCGSEIGPGAKYYTFNNKLVVCERCFREAPRCSVCKLPTAPSEIDPETGACPACLAKLPRCKACGKPILGTFYKYPNTEGVYCAECKNNRPSCAICGVPVGDQHWKYPDGRIICRECGERAVFDPAEIRRIVADVQSTVERRLGLKVKTPYAVRVEKLSGLPSSGALSSEKFGIADGRLYGKELGLYRFENGKSEIVLLFGLPPDLIYETAAHEYAHAWQWENSLSDLGPELTEGFAQWVAAEVLREKGFRAALEKLEARRDFPYGTGYQRLRSMQQQIILRMMLKKPPGGGHSPVSGSPVQGRATITSGPAAMP